MTTSATAVSSARAGDSAKAPESRRVRVWDPLVRIFHWTLAGAIAIAFLTPRTRIEI